MAAPKITFYVDIVSPFAYIAFYTVKNSPVFKGCEITCVPIVLGGLMKQCGNTPPLMIQNKRKWIDEERLRWSEQLKVPMSRVTPPGFPINTLHIQRALTSLSLARPELLERAVLLFWESTWPQWKEPTEPENILAIIKTVIGSEEDAQRIVDAMQSDEVKKTLISNTDKAFKDGAFGLPWFVATNAKGETERFWGVDHMGQLCDHLELERPGGKAWKSLL
ncbi:2-hydroxychromene-2-carboxylate isomeras-like protein [Plenodomus tracheiphilus IPT5]|uniref:Glutathione S-transferase kappa n=1 Tax=Plenodomus tracheiphilus IPT5 TaxID=1408161 RepID=A0A6A7BGG1_9PLEO|nr:2-hydroxychromene-2-carboxylate isomeras-like protein [Plenodomus tracheiphilus IPT5]